MWEFEEVEGDGRSVRGRGEGEVDVEVEENRRVERRVGARGNVASLDGVRVEKVADLDAG